MKDIARQMQFIDSLPTVARGIILGSLLGVIFIFWYTMLWSGLQNSLAAASQKTSLIKLSIDGVKGKLKLAKELHQKGNADLVADTKLNLVAPADTSKMLHELLLNSDRLLLVQLKNSPAKQVKMGESGSILFEHGITLKFLGDYFATLDYLKNLEQLGWKIYWDRLEYRVLQYPEAEITLVIHTLSNRGDWIGA